MPTRSEAVRGSEPKRDNPSVTGAPKEKEVLAALVSSLDPRLEPGEFVFVDPGDLSRFEDSEVIATIAEAEGPSAVVTRTAAERLGLPHDLVLSWIRLGAESGLDAVGLTALVSSTLARHSIACNVIAGLRHDHLFVPSSDAQRALVLLRDLTK